MAGVAVLAPFATTPAQAAEDVTPDALLLQDRWDPSRRHLLNSHCSQARRRADKFAVMPQPRSPAPLPRSLKWRAYGLVRPLVGPVARRLRMFFVGRLHDEIAELRSELRALRETIERARVAEAAGADERVREVMAQALATLALDPDGRR